MPISSTGSFPVEVAYRLLDSYCHAPSVVLDPFCGKGSTLLAARLLGHAAFGIDIAPEAVVCSAAKLVCVTHGSFKRYISGIRLGNPSLAQVRNEVRTFFHAATLRQILSLRNRFHKDLDSTRKAIRSHATFGLGCLLGILHGHASYSLSIRSAHAFSMAPSYVARYAKDNGLRAPNRDVRQCLVNKARHLLNCPLPKVVRGDVRYGCATAMDDIFPQLVEKVDVILTSPPYLNAQTYAKDNWLRLWLLGHDHRKLQPDYIETGSPTLYEHRLSDVFEQCNRMLRTNGLLICIAGDVRLRNRASTNGSDRPIFETGTALAQLAAKHIEGCNFLEQGSHTVNSTSRYFHSINKSNGHAIRPLVERFFVARKAAS